MVQKHVTPQGWLGSTPGARRPQMRGVRAGGSLAVASSTPATQLFSPANMLKLNHAWNGPGAAPLRDEGTLDLGPWSVQGGVKGPSEEEERTHNLRPTNADMPTPPW